MERKSTRGRHEEGMKTGEGSTWVHPSLVTSTLKLPAVLSPRTLDLRTPLSCICSYMNTEYRDARTVSTGSVLF